MSQKKVFVAMSGGVDSSVSAALLKQAGYDVYGVFMQGWANPNFDCEWKEERRDAARVAGVLDIPFKVLDFSRDYYEHVVSYLISEYKAGRTPNPDIMCNKEIKFGLFYRWVMAEGADFVATGHYIQKEGDHVFAGADRGKDQTYFLWTLTKDIIEHSLFPIGSYQKSEVRILAEKFKLPVADKKDSQGVCFVGEGSMVNFLKENIKATAGDIKTIDGNVIGHHEGVELFTIGQRHGIGTPGGGGVYYVADKDLKTGVLTVARGDEDPILQKSKIMYTNPNWIHGVSLPLACMARIRYRQTLSSCTVYENTVVFDEPQKAVAPGQSIVFYKDDEMLGGAIIN
ncbi:MAG: tRNA 2-thiouridine(34) synthase MnmA [bacterium]|nr:tRNA 2-thiouridine(34) synthase MnmA [bacterium]